MIPLKEKEVLRKMLYEAKSNIKITAIIPSNHQMFDLFMNFISELKEIRENFVDMIIIDDPKTMLQYLDVSMFPVFIISGRDVKIKFYDLPVGLEMVMFIDALSAVINEPDNKPIRNLKSVTIKILVSPTCSLCVPVMRTVIKFAMLSKNCTIEVLDVLENAKLLERYGVLTVPVIMVNDDILYTNLDEEKIASFLVKHLTHSLS
ncbi:MAG: thioredoxin family protein [Thermoprotei archaeon]